MKWNKENKERLYRLIWEKLDGIKSKAEGNSQNTVVIRHNLRMAFLRKFGIERIEHKQRLGDDRGRYLWIKPHTQKSATSKDRIIILDPWVCSRPDYKPRRSRGYVDGLSIPKEVAEKFLVLGVP